MWSEQPLENHLKDSLQSLSQPIGQTLLADYLSARRFVTEEIAGRISAKEPDITDHSENHLADVMKRANALLGDKVRYFDPLELYVFCVSVLFHDVGNLHGRSEHHKKIADIYNDCRKQEARFNAERSAVLAIAGAHTGSTKDGSKDTLREVRTFSFQGQTIRAQEIAAVLRLADELAEGPHRTSAYVLNHGGYKPSSRIFHRYASAAEYCVDRDRIALSYTVNMERGASGLEVGNDTSLKEFLLFCYGRIAKVDEERRYCKHYCDLLLRLKETGASFEFWFNGQKVNTDIEPLSLSDLLVPGEHPRDVIKLNERYEPADLVPKLEAECKGA